MKEQTVCQIGGGDSEGHQGAAIYRGNRGHRGTKVRATPISYLLSPISYLLSPFCFQFLVRSRKSHTQKLEFKQMRARLAKIPRQGNTWRIFQSRDFLYNAAIAA